MENANQTEPLPGHERLSGAPRSGWGQSNLPAVLGRGPFPHMAPRGPPATLASRSSQPESLTIPELVSL